MHPGLTAVFVVGIGLCALYVLLSNREQPWSHNNTSRNANNNSIHEDININDENNICTICLGSLKDKAIKRLPCLHVFCYKCIESWYKSNNGNNRSCPNCRASAPRWS